MFPSSTKDRTQNWRSGQDPDLTTSGQRENLFSQPGARKRDPSGHPRIGAKVNIQ